MLLRLNQVQLETPLDQTGECIVLTELIVPRNGIARRAAVKSVTLQKGKRNFARHALYETALLKEKVDGPFGLKVSVTRPMKHPELNQFLRQLLATSIESSSNWLQSSFITHHLLDAVLDEAGQQLADRVLDAESFVASGGLDLDAEALTSGKIKIPLKLTQTLRRSDLPPGPKSRDKRKSQAKTYRKGMEIGQIMLDLLT